jgi:uncharacterized protein YndB with AHSA1/START domain
MKNEKNQNAPTENDVLISRTVSYPRERVFRMWTDPEHLARWFAPRGCTISFKQLDIREGGHFHSCISNPDFGDCWCVGTYLEIVVPERIVYRIGIADEAGNRRTAAEAGMDPDWPDETIVTITFRDLGTATELCLHQTADKTIAKRTGAYPSWLQMFDILEEQMALAAKV